MNIWKTLSHKRGEETVALEIECPICQIENIPRRLIAKVVGSDEKLKIWQCKNCKGLWS